MNKLIYLGLMLIGVLTFSCTKEGPAGADGQDAITLCIQCHTEANMQAIDLQYEESGHGIGANVAYAGGRNGCAMCHSNEGFIETQKTGMDTTAADIPIPTRISCETCHSGTHRSFDVENDGNDYALRTTSPVDLQAFNQTLDLGDESNLCANCHQPRTAPPTPDNDGNFYVSSTHYGPHHGPHSTVLAGIGGYTFGTVVNSEVHASAGATCITCHMNEGDHKWEPSLDACKTCHTDAASFDLGGKQTEINGLISSLKSALIDKGLLDDAGHPVKGTFPVAQAGALYNYEMIVDDRSAGVHNYPFIKDLLDASIAALAAQ